MGNAISSFGMNAAPDHVMAWPRLVLGDWHSHGKFLIVPASPDTARLQTFQIMQLPLRGGLPSMLFEQLLKRIRDYSQTDGLYGGAIHKIREFYFFWSGIMPQSEPRVLVERLGRDTQNGALAVFYLEDDPRFTLIRERSGPAVLPRGDDVSGWSVKQRLLAMLDAVPGAALKAFGPTVAAELRAFFSLRNLEIVATIFVLVVAVQAVPVADGAVDIALFSLALAQFGWSGVLTLRDLIAAVVMAARAKNRATIDAAAEKAAQALVSLGVTALLAAVVKRFSEGTLAQKDEELPTSKSAQASPKPQAVEAASKSAASTGRVLPSGQTLWRVDSRSPDTILTDGCQPRGTATDLQNYVNTNTPSAFVSTSKSSLIAENPAFAQPGSYLYEIDGSGLQGIDVNEAYPSNPFANEQEIAIIGGIPREAIVSARQILPSGGLGAILKNPFYGGGP